MHYTVHRGMFHSIPALLIFTGLAFLICGSTNLHLRYFKAGGVFLGVVSHLMLDEIYSVEWAGGRWRFKSSFGTALEALGRRLWGEFFRVFEARDRRRDDSQRADGDGTLRPALADCR